MYKNNPQGRSLINMSIAQKLENNYKNQIKMIKKLSNGIEKNLLIGSIVADIGKNSITPVAKAIGSCFRKVKSCLEIYLYGEQQKLEFRGRKKIITKYPKLENDIHSIMKNNTYTDSHFETEIQFCSLTINEVMNKLINFYKYPDNFISRSSLANLLNKLDYNLKKVKRNKPLKKIAQTDNIFKNVNKQKQEAMEDEETALISIDTKDKVLIGPYSRKGKSRVLVEACDHELTNRCLIPFGILDLKTNQSYFYNFKNKPTSEAIVDAIEDYIKQNQKYNKISILLDNGPDNSGVRTAFLKGLVDLANKYKKKIRLIYYPPYHSKYNPIERIWARLEIMWNGMLLLSEDICNKVMEKLTWKEVPAKVKYITKDYKKGITYSKTEMNTYNNNIIRDVSLKKWSILITP